jgi:hypothetical protein
MKISKVVGRYESLERKNGNTLTHRNIIDGLERPELQRFRSDPVEILQGLDFSTAMGIANYVLGIRSM